MGLFERLKEGISHTGVKVALEAPVMVDAAAAGFDAKVTLTADAAATIEKVEVTLEKVSYNNGITIGTQTDGDDVNAQILFQAPVSGPVTLQPGAPQTIQFHVPINDVNAALQGVNTANPLMQGLLSIAKTASNMGRHRYYLKAHAKVQGHVLGPSDKVELNLGR